MKIAEGTQYSKQIIVDQIKDTRKKIKLFMNSEMSEEHRDRMFLADDRLSQALQWLTKRV